MAEHDDSIELLLADGTVCRSSFTPPFSVAEQVAYEEQFRQSFLNVDRGFGELAKAAEAAAGEAGPGATVDPAGIIPVTQILWFAWRRARGRVPQILPRFKDFLGQLEDWNFLETEPPPADTPVAASEQATALGVTDPPTAPPDGEVASTDPLAQGAPASS